MAAFRPESGSRRKARAGGPEIEAAQEEKERESGFQHANRGLQAIWRGPHVDSRLDDAALHAVQRRGAGYIEMARAAAHSFCWSGLCC